MSRRDADPARLLGRALAASAAGAGCEAAVTAIHTRPWASATYVGARHLVTLDAPAGIARYRWLAALGETELPVRGHVALPPAILAADDASVTLEAIVLEDH